FSNVYGRFDNDIDRMERVIPLFIRKISNDEDIVVYGPDKVLDFTYVDDCVEGVSRGIYALAEGRVSKQTINLAFGQGNSLIRMAELIGQATGVEPRMTVEPALVGEVTHYVADISRARELLGYRPRVSLEEGIRRTVQWNREWTEREQDGARVGGSTAFA
ncbi:MAG TPA: GDP-mannose 4,6-dehydratase, partial [Allosphingosinicella sp.]|nr:GDP-mannose 4,6-dehydratase [Allosphingosinicella sp.]